MVQLGTKAAGVELPAALCLFTKSHTANNGGHHLKWESSQANSYNERGEVALTHLLHNTAGWPCVCRPSSSGLECHRVETWVPTFKMFSLTTFLTPNVWAFSSHQSTLQLSRYHLGVVGFSSNTNSMESAQTPEVKGSVPQDRLARFRHQVQVQATYIVTHKL